MDKTKNASISRTTIKTPRYVHKAFKVLCAEHGVSVSSKLTQLMIDAVKQDQAKKDQFFKNK